MQYPELETELTVYYADTDAGGVVYYTRYLEYLEAGRMEYLTAIGCDAFECHKNGIFFAVREMQAKYLLPARLGDKLKVISRVTEVTRFTMTFQSWIILATSNQCLHEAEIKCVCINADGKLLPLPEPLQKIQKAGD